MVAKSLSFATYTFQDKRIRKSFSSFTIEESSNARISCQKYLKSRTRTLYIIYMSKAFNYPCPHELLSIFLYDIASAI